MSSSDLTSLLSSRTSRALSKLEFSGPLLEKCTGRLEDGTTFTVTGLKEDPNSPESPLKIMAMARDRGVEYSVDFGKVEKIKLGGDGYKEGEGGIFENIERSIIGRIDKAEKKNFANDRVREAQERTKEKARRREEDNRYLAE